MTKGKFRKETSAAQQKRRTILQTYLTSLVSLVLCVTMFFGTTAAWFTDTVETNQNQMMVGTLKVQLDHASYKEGKLGDYEDVTQNNHKVFTTDTKWEPGYTAVEKFRLTELGSLAFGYKLNITLGDATVLDQATYKAFTEAISVWNYSGTDASGYQLPADFDAIAAPNSGWNKVGTLYDVLSNQLTVFSGSMDYKKVQEEKAAVEHIIALHMDEECDGVVGTNETIQGLTLDKIKITLVATQMSSENDAFGSDYDAAPGADKWDGEEAKPEDAPADEDNDGVIAINTADELAGFAAAVNAGTSYSGKTIVLASDIDLGNKAWTPIGQNGDKGGFQGIFDGQGHTIYNLYVNQENRAYQAAGLFGSAGYATIKNFKVANATIINLDDAGDSSNGAAVVDGAAQFDTTIDNVDVDNATVTGNRRVSAIAGYYVGTITNCDVKGVNLVLTFDDMGNDTYDNADKAGLIIAYSNGASTITNNTVTDCSITGYRDIGGIAGYATSSTLTNNKVDGLIIMVDGAHNYKNYAELAGHDAKAIIGEGTADDTNTAADVSIQMKISDGLTQDSDSNYYVSNADGLATLNQMMADKTAGRDVDVNLTADIDFTGKTWTPVDSHADTAFEIAEINGNGHTISNLTINGQAMFTRFAGSGDVIIKDITFDKATVNSTAINTSILTVQTYQNVLLDNVDVKNSTITGAYKVAPLIATVYNESSTTVTATLNNCDVSNTTVKATSYDFCTAGMVAFVYEGDNDKVVFENCTVTNVKLMAKPNGYESHACVYVNDADTDDCFNEVEGVTVTNCTFEALS